MDNTKDNIIGQDFIQDLNKEIDRAVVNQELLQQLINKINLIAADVLKIKEAII